MKLNELFKAVPQGNAPDAGRPTPVAALGNYGWKNAPLFSELCKDREWCEKREAKKKAKKLRKKKNEFT